MYQGKHVRHRRARSVLTRLLLFVLCLFLLWPFAEPYTLEVDQQTISSDGLPADVGQLRIVYASDFHLRGFPFLTKGRLDSIVSRINALNADLVLLGGDYAERPEDTIAFFRSLGNIHASYGVYAILGEHDRTLSDDEESLRSLRVMLRSKGINLLLNSVETIRIGNASIYLAGLDDVNSGWPDLKRVAAGVHQEDYVIFLCHSPEIIPSAQTAVDQNGRRGWFDLGLFGHTHGGQLALFGPLLHLADGIDAHYLSGWLVENRTPMLISRGIGASVVPMRWMRSPQIHLITVRSTRTK